MAASNPWGIDEGKYYISVGSLAEFNSIANAVESSSKNKLKEEKEEGLIEKMEEV